MYPQPIVIIKRDNTQNITIRFLIITLSNVDTVSPVSFQLVISTHQILFHPGENVDIGIIKPVLLIQPLPLIPIQLQILKQHLILVNLGEM